MFTGIIRDVGEVIDIQKGNGGWTLRIATSLSLEDTPPGASICCGGCCLTVIEKHLSEGGVDNSVDSFDVEVSFESLDLTVIKDWEIGQRINIEPSLKMGDELGGHMVSGHVDGVATLESIGKDGDSWRLRIRVSDDLAGFIAPKGSIALNGISLTVNEVEHNVFGVNIIPHTWEHTDLQYHKPGDQINIEIDTIARYVARLVDYRLAKVAK